LVIINETMARRFWPHESAIGRRIGDRQGDVVVWREIIGVVRDIQDALNPSDLSTMYQVYKPLVNEPWGYLWLIVRTPAPATFKNELRRAVADVDPDIAVQQMVTVPESADQFLRSFIVVNDTLGDSPCWASCSPPLDSTASSPTSSPSAPTSSASASRWAPSQATCSASCSDGVSGSHCSAC